MFTKLSALALCLSFVSARLRLIVQDVVYVDSSIPVNATFGESAPTYIDLLLFAPGFNTTLEKKVELAPAMYVHIPEVRPGSQYTISATEVGDDSFIYATSNEFQIEE